MMSSLDAILWGGFLRFGQATLAGAPTFMVGLIIAGVFRKLLGTEATLKAFGGKSWRSLPLAWVWGMLLPVCSLGVIPVAYELRRAGLSGGSIMAFALTAPLFNPLSLLYGLTLSSPAVLMAFAAASLIVVTTVGFAWDLMFPGSALTPTLDPPTPPGLGRIVSVGVVAARYASGPSLVFCAIGLAGSIVLAAIFPFGSLTDSMAHTDPMAPLQMLVVAIPAYATPLNVMMQVGGMFVHGNSVGAAYVLLALGAGANLGQLAWAYRAYGLKQATAFLAVFVVVVMMIAYSIEDSLYSAGEVDHPHTHAFDVYACPFTGNGDDLATKAWVTMRDDARMYEVVGLAGVCLLVSVGAVLRVMDPENHLEATLAHWGERQRSGPNSVLHADLPGPVLGAVSLVGLVILSVAGCYVFYPAPEDTLEDLRIVRADALAYAASGDVENAVKSIERYDDLTRKLQVGFYLRNLQLSEFQQARARVLRGRLERLKDMLEADHDFDDVRACSWAISESHRRVREAFLPDRQSGPSESSATSMNSQ